MVQLVCGTCNHPMQLSEKSIGRMAKCSACGMTFVVPQKEGKEPIVVTPVTPPQRGANLDVNAPPPAPTPPPQAAAARAAPVYGLKPEEPPPPAAERGGAPGPGSDPGFARGVEKDRFSVQTGRLAHGERLKRERRRNKALLAAFGSFLGLAAVVVVVWVAFELGKRRNSPPAATPASPHAQGTPRPAPSPAPPRAGDGTVLPRDPHPAPPRPADPLGATRRHLADQLAEVLRLEHDSPELALARYVALSKQFTDPALYPVGFRIDEKILLMRQRVAAGSTPVVPVVHGLEVTEKLRLFVPSPEERAVHVMGYLTNTGDRFIEEARIRVNVPGAGGRASVPCQCRVCFIPPRSATIPFVVCVHGVDRHSVGTPATSACVIDQVRLGLADYRALPILPGFRLSQDRRKVTGEVKNDHNLPMTDVRVLCELHRSDGLLLLREETTPTGAGVPMQPGDSRQFELTWSEQVDAVGPELFRIICRAVGRPATR